MNATEPRLDTKQRILDSAERLFAEHGIEGASIRTIVNDAQVNLAAIHYHYHSKEALLDAVLLRRLGPINRERLDLLAGCGDSPSVEEILHAFIAPAVRVGADPDLGGQTFVRLMGRIISGEGNHLLRIVKQHFSEVIQRFTAALHKALPELPLPEVMWRMHFTAGAMAHTLRGCQEMASLSGGLCDPSDVQALTRRLVSFAAAGFRSPGVNV